MDQLEAMSTGHSGPVQDTHVTDQSDWDKLVSTVPKHRRKIIVDCDAGVDDAEALCLMTGYKDVDIVAVTCVNGNKGLEQICYNVRRVLAACKRPDIPIFSGCSQPMVRLPEATDFHGKDGLGDADLSNETEEQFWPELQKEHATTALARLCREHVIETTGEDTFAARADQARRQADTLEKRAKAHAKEFKLRQAQALHEDAQRLRLYANNCAALASQLPTNSGPGVEIVALGPLTNLAVAARIDASFPCLVRNLVCMGGVRDARGNVPGYNTAEFNCHSDPVAMQMVLNDFPSTTILPWETAADNQMDWAVVDEWHSGTSKGEFLKKLLHGIEERALSLGWRYVPCDPLAAAVALFPHLVVAQSGVAHRHVDVELAGTHAQAATIIDWEQLRGEGRKNAFVITKTNQQGLVRALSFMSRFEYTSQELVE